MIITSIMFDLSECENLQTAQDWQAWLKRAQGGVPRIEPNEAQALSVWGAFQALNEIFRQWKTNSGLTLDDLQPAMREFVELQAVVHRSIDYADFPTETAGGLAVKLIIKSTSLRLRDAPKYAYDAALEWAAFEASALSTKHQNPNPTNISAVIPDRYSKVRLTHSS